MCVLMLGLMFFSSLLLEDRFVFAQEQITDQVAVTVLRNQIFAFTTEEGFVRADLSAGEEVLSVEARGLNALVHTSTRLLGFSGKVQRWAEQRTDIYEQIIEKRVTPRFIFVRTNKRLYGFQGITGRWKVEEWGAREELREAAVSDHLALVITERRVLAFSAFTGGFFSHDLLMDERVTETAINDNIAVLSTPVRRLIFRSQLKVWAEIR